MLRKRMTEMVRSHLGGRKMAVYRQDTKLNTKVTPKSLKPFSTFRSQMVRDTEWIRISTLAQGQNTRIHLGLEPISFRLRLHAFKLY